MTNTVLVVGATGLVGESALHRFAARPGWDAIPAVRSGDVVEIKSPIILQPGPAALFDGLSELHRHIAAWAAR